MKIFDFSEKVGKQITAFQSNFIMSKIVNHQGNIHIGAMHLKENGIIDIMKQLYRNCFLLWTEKDMYAGQIKKSEGGSGTSCVLGEG